MSDHNAIRGLLAAVALGAATDEERLEVDRHSATCPDCRAELDSLRAATAALAMEVPQLDPPASLKRRVVASVREDAAQRRRAHVGRGARRRRALWPAVTAILAAAVIGLLAWNVSLRGGNGSATRDIAFSGASPEVTGRLVIRDDGTAVMRVQGLPPAGPGKGYELWTIRDGKPRSEGFAARTGGGDVVVATADVADAAALALTPEPRTNVTSPTGPKVVVVEL